MNDESTSPLAMQTTTPASPLGVATVSPPSENIEVTAETVDEMEVCQSAMIAWCQSKIAAMRSERDELKETHDRLVKHKWKSDKVKRLWHVATHRTDFYERLLTALQHGYQIVPSFPVTAFAIRTDKSRPLRMYTNSWLDSHTQEAPILHAGEGEYKNPFPKVRQMTISEATPTKGQTVAYWAEEWKDLEFPLAMAKPRIIEATTRAMALKIFDDLAILPGFEPSKGTRPPKGDPIIVARLQDPRKPGPYNPPRYITFIVAWHLNTKEL